jgi:hypothetical protein
VDRARRRIWIIASIIVVVALVTAGTRFALDRFKPSPAQSYLSEIHVSGYRQIGSSHEIGPGTTSATDIFFGPAASGGALLKAISGPDLNLQVTNPAALGIATMQSDQFVLALLKKDPGSSCGVEVDTFISTAAIDSSWNLSEQQARQVRARTSMIFDIGDTCGTG